MSKFISLSDTDTKETGQAMLQIGLASGLACQTYLCSTKVMSVTLAGSHVHQHETLRLYYTHRCAVS